MHIEDDCLHLIEDDSVSAPSGSSNLPSYSYCESFDLSRRFEINNTNYSSLQRIF